jgi:hypothetical protein
MDEFDDGDLDESSMDVHGDGDLDESADDEMASMGVELQSSGPFAYQAAQAGVVTVTLDGYYLDLGPVELNPGWFVKEQKGEGDKVEFEFHSCETKVEFKAEYDNGQIKFEV